MEVGIYLRAASNIEEIRNILVMRPKEEGGSSEYVGTVDVYLPVLANNAMAGYTLIVEKVPGNLTVVASPTNLHKNGWQTVAVDEPTAIVNGNNVYMGVGGVFAPVLTFDYSYDFGQETGEVTFDDIEMKLTLTDEITGNETVYRLILSPETAIKLDLTFNDKCLTYDDGNIGWSEYIDILTLTMDFGTDMSNVYVAVNNSFANNGSVGSTLEDSDDGYITSVSNSISAGDGHVLLADDSGTVFGSEIYVSGKVQDSSYAVMSVSDFLDKYVEHKPDKKYGEEVFDYSDHPGWYDTPECMTPFNFESLISNKLDVYAGYGIDIYVVPFTDPSNPDASDKEYSVSPDYVLLGKPGSEVDLMDVYETLTITSGYDKVSEGTVWWYKDADVLENYLHFRANVPVDEYFRNLKKKLPWFYSLAFLAPAFLVKLFMRPFAYEKGMGTQWWPSHDIGKLNAYYGSIENYRSIKSWKQMIPPDWKKNIREAEAAGEIRILDHGYDTSRPIYSLTDSELETAAAFRGGHFIGLAGNGSPAPEQARTDSSPLSRKPGLIYEWECENGHRFRASLEYVLLGGGWCAECPIDEVCDCTTEKNRFISQVLRAQSLE